MPRLSRLAWCVIACVLGAATVAQSGETLYNGIVLPDDWPPKLENVHVDPVTPCYLQVPPAVIPIDVGRQLFVDDFLIDSTTLQRGLHQAEYYLPAIRFRMPRPTAAACGLTPLIRR